LGRQKRKEYAFYAVLAGTFLLIAGAYGSGEKSVQQNAKEMGAVAEKAVAEPEYVPAVRLYAGIFTKLDGEEYAVIEKNKDILVAAANRGYFDESDVYSFLQGPKSWGEGRAWSGEWSNQYVRGNYFGNFGCGLCKYIQYIFRSYLFAVGHVFVCKRGLRLHTDEKDRCDRLGRYENCHAQMWI